jgi:hypothetical protein
MMKRKTQCLLGWIIAATLALMILTGVFWTKRYLLNLPQRVFDSAEEVSNGSPYCFVLPIRGNFENEKHLFKKAPIAYFIEKEVFSPYPALIERILKGQHPNWLERPFHFGIITRGVSYQWSFKNESFYERGFARFDFSDTKDLPEECLSAE